MVGAGISLGVADFAFAARFFVRCAGHAQTVTVAHGGVCEMGALIRISAGRAATVGAGSRSRVGAVAIAHASDAFIIVAKRRRAWAIIIDDASHAFIVATNRRRPLTCITRVDLTACAGPRASALCSARPIRGS